MKTSLVKSDTASKWTAFTVGNCKTWTLDYGLDRDGLDYGL